MRTGKPIFRAAVWASSAVGKPSPAGPLSPGTTGVPAPDTVFRASVLLPILRIASADGPMKVIPADAQASAKSSFSDRNPYPGWTASAPVCRQAARILSITR